MVRKVPTETTVDESQTPSGNPQDTVLEGNTPNTDLLGSLVDSHASGYEGFDPTIHAANEDGTPKTKADGSYAKKRGRKAGSVNTLPAADSAPAGDQAALTPAPETKPKVTKEMADAAGRTAANLMFHGSVMCFGNEWRPEKEEALGIKMAFTDYFMARGIPRIPPEIALLAVIAMYAVPRTKLPETRKKIDKIKAKFGIKPDAESTDSQSS